MPEVNLSCSYCGNQNEYKKHTLAAYLGKRIQLKCKSCGQPYQTMIDAAILDGQKESITNIDLNDHSTKKRKFSLQSLIAKDADSDKEFAIPLKEGSFVVGRKTNLDDQNKIAVPIAGRTVSRAHFQLTSIPSVYGVGFEIKDLQSTNGTKIGSERLSEDDQVLLQPGDVITAGNLRIYVK